MIWAGDYGEWEDGEGGHLSLYTPKAQSLSKEPSLPRSSLLLGGHRHRRPWLHTLDLRHGMMFQPSVISVSSCHHCALCLGPGLALMTANVDRAHLPLEQVLTCTRARRRWMRP